MNIQKFKPNILFFYTESIAEFSALINRIRLRFRLQAFVLCSVKNPYYFTAAAYDI